MPYPTLQWQKCPCGHRACNLWQPINFGQFYQGTGFTSVEKEIITNAFARANEANAAEDALSRTLYPDHSGQ